jgi:hypothetical protein
LSRGHACVNAASAIAAAAAHAIPVVMTEESTIAALSRIEKALARIEAASRRVPTPSNDSEARYQALRSRTQAALASLETVIAKVGGGR